jgi:hypothetical protein
MRWSSQVFIFIALAVTSIFEGIFAAPLDVILEKRVELVITPDSLKSSSSTYRKTALAGLTFTTTLDGKAVSQIPTPASPPPGKDAGR